MSKHLSKCRKDLKKLHYESIRFGSDMIDMVCPVAAHSSLSVRFHTGLKDSIQGFIFLQTTLLHHCNDSFSFKNPKQTTTTKPSGVLDLGVRPLLGGSFEISCMYVLKMEKGIFGQWSIFISALLFLMKPDDKDLSFKLVYIFWISIFNFFL